MNLQTTNKQINVQDIDIITINAEGKCTSHWVQDPELH